VSLTTITNIWGSGKALRGKDGSMDEAVEGINDEREIIFRSFACGLAGNLCTVLGACFIIMEHPINLVASVIVLYTAWMIYWNAVRIQKKFFLVEYVRLDDLTKYPQSGGPNSNMTTDSGKHTPSEVSEMSSSSNKANNRSRRSLLDVV
jgi:hypothetical protein